MRGRGLLFVAKLLSYSVMPASSVTYLPARYYALLCLRLVECGVDVPSLLEQAGVSPAALYAADGQLTPQQVERLAALASEQVQRSDLGFELGRLLKLSSHDILGYALLSAPTLDAALRLAARFFSLVTPTYTMRYLPSPEQAELRFVPRLPLTTAVLDFHLEAIAVAFHEHIRTLLGDASLPSQLYFSFAEPKHVTRYKELLGATPHFSQDGLPGARILLPGALLGRPLAMADAHAMRMAESRCAELLARITRNASLGAWTKMMLSEAADAAHSLPELAGILNLSPRTLERRLAQEGAGFRGLALEARHARACALLSARQLSVTQIAYQLGYGDVANFSRAFRKQAGVPPSQWLAARETAQTTQ